MGQVWGKQEYPEKTSQSTATSATNNSEPCRESNPGYLGGIVRVQTFLLMKKQCMVDLSQITGPTLKISPEYFNALCVEEVPVQGIGAVETVKDECESAYTQVVFFEAVDPEMIQNTLESKNHSSLSSKAYSSVTETHSRVTEKETVKDKAKYTCEICFKKFTQLGNLCIHQRIHSGDRPFQCTFCSKTFTQLCNMWKHVRTHTGEKPYHCPVCGRAFSQQANMAKHLRIHTGERPFQCDRCHKSFTQRANLLKHELVHTGERPFVCRYCGKGFSQVSNLDKHQRVHTGVKPYSCSTCGRSFTQQGNLAKHVAVHSKSKPFACPHCTKSYTQKYNLEKHVQRCQIFTSN